MGKNPVGDGAENKPGRAGAADRKGGGGGSPRAGFFRRVFDSVERSSRKSGAFPCILFALSCLATLGIQFASRPEAALLTGLRWDAPSVSGARPDSALPADSVVSTGRQADSSRPAGHSVPSALRKGGPPDSGCAVPATAKASVDAFLGEVEWRSKFLLEAVIAAFAFLLALQVVWASLASGWETRRTALSILLAMGGLLLLGDIATILSMKGVGAIAELTAASRERFPGLPAHEGFLSRLLATLPPGCLDIRLSAVWGRLAGEPVGFCIGIAMYAAAIVPERAGTGVLAGRSRTLNHLLYAASLLFVAGLLMSSANFSWILDQWDWKDSGLGKEDRERIVAQGVELAGVAYSAILAVFFLPTRALLEARVRAAMGGQSADLESREKWRKENGFNGGWKEDVRQIMAILAPVITAPLFKALVE